ncbi:MAG: UDP-N-acetylglucosamine 1-carboxyvinyltransferase [Holophagales bacterium]|jgi:UDP-N-acetylglucosamine 1-carboxyvinyltransferase|nr:UDP-N-acetylglucosamine 1-carboxyvinyltransferase [Holophagales bacterium]
MDRLIVSGGNILSGTVPISGAKNAALPCLAASLLTTGKIVLDHLPAVADIRTMIKVLQALGCDVTVDKTKDAFELSAVVKTDSLENGKLEAPYELVKTMRASILVLGPLLARFGRASVSLPGGCAIGARPVNLHLDALQRMGAKITIDGGYIVASVPGGRLTGIDHTFDKVSVGATENLMMAACLASGVTVLRNAAVEPEIGDLAAMLRAMGAKIDGIGTPVLTIVGSDLLGGCRHAVIPDRIEAGTFICALAAAGGDIVLERVEPDDLRPLTDLMTITGCGIEEQSERGGAVKRLRVFKDPGVRLRSRDVITAPHPGFPTDLQAQMMAVMTQAAGISIIRETIFENRFQHAMELERLGANLRVEGNTAIVAGPSQLKGCTVMATDLRASAALVIAGLAAKGDVTIDRVYHLDRGYAGIERKLQTVGAGVQRVKGGRV